MTTEVVITRCYGHPHLVDLSLPLRSIAPILEADVLAVLTRTHQPLTGRGIASLTRRGTPQGTQKTLDRLVATGIVDSQPAGRARLYTLNRDHLLVPAIEAAVGARAELLARLGRDIAAWEIGCVHAPLFGSLARGEAGPSSDIDVLVVRPSGLRAGDADRWEGQLHEAENSVRRWTGNPLAWFETTELGLAGAVADGEPILDAWRADGITLAGQSLSRLLSHAANFRPAQDAPGAT